jgi:hypothetical protein
MLATTSDKPEMNSAASAIVTLPQVSAA